MPVRRLGSVIQPFVLAMLDPRGQCCLCGTIRSQFVRDDHAWLAPSFEQLHEKTQRGCFVPARLNQNIEDVAIGIDRAPKPMLTALDRDDGLVEVPFVGWARPIPADLGRKLNAKVRHPVSDGFVRNRDPARGKKIFNVA
jgi:hypothetical protein